MFKRYRLPAALFGGVLLTIVFAIDAYKSRLDTDLMRAIAKENVPQVRSLLARGANPDTKGTNNEWAFYSGVGEPESLYGYSTWNKITLPLYNLTHPSPRSMPSLVWAVGLKDPQIALALLDHGATVDVVDTEDRTPLIYACMFGQVGIVQRLIAQGANVNTCDNDEGTALTYALLANRWQANGHDVMLPMVTRQEIVLLLLRAGANVNEKSSDGFTSLDLYRPAEGKRDPLVALLVKHGAVWPETAPKTYGGL